MKKILLLALALLTTGCHSRLFESPKDTHKAQFYTVACCQDNSGGSLSYPSFVPQAHKDFCERVRVANNRDQNIDGDTYLAMGVDCGKGHYSLGDQYYPSTGY